MSKKGTLHNHDYDKEITDYVRHAKTLQRNVTSVQVIDGYDPHIRVRVADRKKLHAVTDAIGQIADAPIATTSVKAPNGWKQPPMHTAYKDDRIVDPDNVEMRDLTPEQRARLRAARGE